METNYSSSHSNPLSKKVNKVLDFDVSQESLNALKNVSDIVTENNLTTRRNLRANIEMQSLLINEQFMTAFYDVYQHFQQLCDSVSFIDTSCKKMMGKIEELKFQTSDFLKQTNEVNSELQKLDANEKVLSKFYEDFQLTPEEVAVINTEGDTNLTINDTFFEVLSKIKLIHLKSKDLLANNQYITGIEIMDLMSKYEEMANDKLYRWTIGILRSVNLDIIDPHLFGSLAYLQNKEPLLKHCLEEYTTVRRSAASHQFIEALTRGRTSHNTHFAAIELYSSDTRRYIADMLSFLHQAIVFERDMLKTLLKLCDQERLAKNNVIRSALSSITEGLIRPLKIRVENCLVSNNKNLNKERIGQIENTKNYFYVKNIINFYLQTFTQILLEDSSLIYLLRELLILSDRVFYNSLNFYCSSRISQNFDSNKSQVNNIRFGINSSEQIENFINLIDELLDCIKSSMSANVQEQQLETHRILSSVLEPFMQYVVIYSSKLSSTEVTMFSFNCTYSLKQTIVKYKFTETFSQNLQHQLDEFVEVMLNEQFQHIINSLALTSLYNAVQQNDNNLNVPLSNFSGCDPIAVSNFLNLWDKFLSDTSKFKLSQLEQIIDQQTKDDIWRKCLYQIVATYEALYAKLIDPNNKFADVINSIKYKPEDVRTLIKYD